MGKKTPPDPSFTKRGIHKKPGRARIRVVVLAGAGDGGGGDEEYGRKKIGRTKAAREYVGAMFSEERLVRLGGFVS